MTMQKEKQRTQSQYEPTRPRTKISRPDSFQIPGDERAEIGVEEQHDPNRRHGEVVVGVNGRRDGSPRDSSAFALEHADELATQAHASVDGEAESDLVAEG